MHKKTRFTRISSALLMMVFLLTSFSSDKVTDNLVGLLGKPLDSPEVSKFCQPLGNFELESSMPKYPHYMFISGGVELVVEASSKKVHSIFLMGIGEMWYEAYSGALPYGLTWNDSRGDVVKKIGSGTLNTSRYVTNVKVQYPELHLEIQYKSNDTTDFSTKISTIQIRTFD